MERLTKYSNDLIRNKAVNILRKLDSKNGLNGDELAIISSFCLIERVENDQLKKYEDLEDRLNAVYGNCDGLLDRIVEHLEQHSGTDFISPVAKARLLTDEDVDRWEEYKTLEDRGKLLKLPCVVGDFALFSDGDIRPVIYIAVSNEDVVVGCQNGIKISMNLQYGSWCKGFFKTRDEAEAALKELKEE